MRSDEEILNRIAEVKERDWLGFERNDLIECLSFEAAKPFLKSNAKEEDWVAAPRDRESVIGRMLDYMPFAWEKANDERGISAGRSMAHYTSWLWLIGTDLGDLLRYQFYGKDNLVKICREFGWDPAQWDDGIRSNGD